MANENEDVSVRLADEFAKVLREYVTSEEFTEICDRNAEETDPRICHSHDFCDANMAMEDAFAIVLRRKPDVASEEDSGIWNRAWNLAKERHLTTKGGSRG